MFQEKILDSSNSASRATYHYVKSAWDKTHKYWLHVYIVYLQNTHVYLPADQLVEALIRPLPGIRQFEVDRYFDRDVLYLHGDNKNIFTTRADEFAKAKRLIFLSEIANVAQETRSVPECIQQVSQQFLNTGNFVSVCWDGSQAIVYDTDGKRLEGRRIRSGKYWKPFRDFERICKKVLPFYFKTAHL